MTKIGAQNQLFEYSKFLSKNRNFSFKNGHLTQTWQRSLKKWFVQFLLRLHLIQCWMIWSIFYHSFNIENCSNFAPIFAGWAMTWLSWHFSARGRFKIVWGLIRKSWRIWWFFRTLTEKSGWQRPDSLAAPDKHAVWAVKKPRLASRRPSMITSSAQLMPMHLISCDSLQHQLKRSTKSPGSKGGFLQKYVFVPLLLQSLGASAPVSFSSTCLSRGLKEV